VRERYCAVRGSFQDPYPMPLAVPSWMSFSHCAVLRRRPPKWGSKPHAANWPCRAAHIINQACQGSLAQCLGQKFLAKGSTAPSGPLPTHSLIRRATAMTISAILWLANEAYSTFLSRSCHRGSLGWGGSNRGIESRNTMR
jgi:hypothetical protein